MRNIITSAVSGGAVVAVIEGVREYLSWRRSRKAAKEDAAEKRIETDRVCKAVNTDKRIESVERKIEALIEGQKFILYDRIRYLGQAYIADGNIDFDDRRILNNMHSSYHNGLGGNGDLDTLMAEVNRLPLKTIK